MDSEKSLPDWLALFRSGTQPAGTSPPSKESEGPQVQPGQVKNKVTWTKIKS